MTFQRQCRFWKCTEMLQGEDDRWWDPKLDINRIYFLCSNHHSGYVAGKINQCPTCPNYKDAEYDVCLACYRQTAGASASSRSQTAQRDDREFPGDREANTFFVYVLTMDGGEYYIGQTREIHERLHEHRNNMSQSTKGRNPRLVWFTVVSTRAEAADLGKELQQLNSNPTGRREINRWVVQFKQLVDELDYTPPKSTVENTVRERRQFYGGVGRPSSRRQR